MKIHGLMKTTLLDYPGKVASTIFLGGCNMRCPFCHNMDLVTGPENITPIPEEEIMQHLKSRSGVIDGVCITGGEPTLQTDLVRLIKSIKDLGLLVKLDTNGSNTSVLEELMSKELIDYIAIDVKSSFNRYNKICGFDSIGYDSNYVDHILDNIKRSISLLINQDSLDYEFRTTVIKEYHDKEVFEEIGNMLKGARAYYLQNFVVSDYVPDKSLHGYSKKELTAFADQLSPKIKIVGIRGID
ncbi:MAG: anaerobic ribonucleoside-triphosphate reductase activating protein [Lachnospiraceae bacterium]|nr:anaerobic ribonucleoside-triphosphate reductase activating protein [Lachnospiraceae bacterium]